MQRIIVCLLCAALAACVGNPRLTGAGETNGARGSYCERGENFAARDQGLAYLRSPVVYDNLEVVRILQENGPLPGQYGSALMADVDAGRVSSYHGEARVLWYFHGDVPLPSTLPVTDRHGICRGNTEVHKSADFPGWQYVKVPHWDRVLLPAELLEAGPVCVRPCINSECERLPLVHVPTITEGSFVRTDNVICGLPGRIREILESGLNGVAFFLVTPPTGGG